jgi:hypothetical protein
MRSTLKGLWLSTFRAWPLAAALATTPSGLNMLSRGFSQGSSFLATLGFGVESLWDSAVLKNAWKVQRGRAHSNIFD